MTVQGDLLAGSIMQVPTTNAKKNQIYRFTAAVRSFERFLMGHGKTEYGSTYLILDQTKITVIRQFADTLSAEKEHGLHIEGSLCVTWPSSPTTGETEHLPAGDSSIITELAKTFPMPMIYAQTPSRIA